MVLMCSPAVRDQLVSQCMNDNILRYKVAAFRPKIRFQLEQGQYIIETATSPEDLLSIIQLREHSFLEDFLPGHDITWNDFDEYDLMADHVLVKDSRSGEILGAYRILCSLFTHNFYSEIQFDLGSFKYKEGIKIELGRACIHKDHRNGITLNLVWKGLGRYAQMVNARYMFGCASIKTMSQELAQSIFWHLAPGHFDGQYGMDIFERYQFSEKLSENILLPWPRVEENIPALLKSYLLAGAKICSQPALDTFFRCIDFITVLDIQNIDPKYHRRYFSADLTETETAAAIMGEAVK